jgi:hypothetical protein
MAKTSSAVSDVLDMVFSPGLAYNLFSHGTKVYLLRFIPVLLCLRVF